MKKSKNLFVAALLLAIAMCFSGCATPAQSGSMASSKNDFGRKNESSLAINVTGGAQTDSMGKSQISNEDFAAAIKMSVEKSGLFAKVLAADASDFRLDVAIVRMDQPTFGFNMTVTLEVNWTLTRRSTGKAVWQRAEVSTHTAKVGDAFSGVTRLRLATEGAARANIEQALGEIGKVDLN